MTFYITKYALTKGILTVEPSDGEEMKAGEGSRVYLMGRTEEGRFPHLFTADFERDEAAARATFERKRTKKIKALRKQLERLEALQPTFSPYRDPKPEGEPDPWLAGMLAKRTEE